MKLIDQLENVAYELRGFKYKLKFGVLNQRGNTVPLQHFDEPTLVYFPSQTELKTDPLTQSVEGFDREKIKELLEERAKDPDSEEIRAKSSLLEKIFIDAETVLGFVRRARTELRLGTHNLDIFINQVRDAAQKKDCGNPAQSEVQQGQEIEEIDL